MLTGPAAFELRHLHGSGSHLQILIFVSREFGGSALRNRPSLATGSGGRWRGSPSAMRCPLWRQGKRSGQRPQMAVRTASKGTLPCPTPNSSRNNGGFQGFPTPGCFPSPSVAWSGPANAPRTGPLLPTRLTRCAGVINAPRAGPAHLRCRASVSLNGGAQCSDTSLRFSRWRF
jgi:hypothetical protein